MSQKKPVSHFINSPCQVFRYSNTKLKCACSHKAEVRVLTPYWLKLSLMTFLAASKIEHCIFFFSWPCCQKKVEDLFFFFQCQKEKDTGKSGVYRRCILRRVTSPQSTAGESTRRVTITVFSFCQEWEFIFPFSPIISLQPYFFGMLPFSSLP